MNDDLMAALTPEAMDAMAKMSLLAKAKRKDKRGPGGRSGSAPSMRRLATESANEVPALEEAASAMGFGGIRDMMMKLGRS